MDHSQDLLGDDLGCAGEVPLGNLALSQHGDQQFDRHGSRSWDGTRIAG